MPIFRPTSDVGDASESDLRSLRVGGLNREYLLHVPPRLSPDRPAPLVFVFHGGSANAPGMERFTRFSELADREGFIAVYPCAVGKHWNDGRETAKFRAHAEKIDDVGFVAAMAESLSGEFAVDADRLFAAGASNGAMLCHRLAAERSDLVAAIAPVMGGMAPAIAARFAPRHPVSVLVVHGTADPIVPYEGGEIGGTASKGLGSVLPTEETVRLWAAHNGCAAATSSEGPAADDGTRVTIATHAGGRRGSTVVLYRIEGGGHTWPGGPQYLPERTIGKTSRAFDATRAIWEFFRTQARA